MTPLRVGNAFAQRLQELGFSTGKVLLCHLYRHNLDVSGPALDDDFVFAEHGRHFRNNGAHMAAKFKVKVAAMGRYDRNELRVLNPSTKRAPGEILYE